MPADEHGACNQGYGMEQKKKLGRFWKQFEIWVFINVTSLQASAFQIRGCPTWRISWTWRCSWWTWRWSWWTSRWTWWSCSRKKATSNWTALCLWLVNRLFQCRHCWTFISMISMSQVLVHVINPSAIVVQFLGSILLKWACTGIHSLHHWYLLSTIRVGL